MDKLREKFLEVAFKKITSEECSKQCEQILDDFSVKFANFVIKYNETHRVHKTPTELQQYFKDNVYNK
jgi:hypothetical protein